MGKRQRSKNVVPISDARLSVRHKLNPAVAFWDYLTNERDGPGIDSGMLDPVSFQDAVSYCKTEYPEVGMSNRVLEGEIMRPSEWRELGGRYGVGDYVTRDGTDIHRCVALNWENGDLGTFECVVAPSSGWASAGDIDYNCVWRYDPADYGGRTD